jgi:hypothetical protein
MKKSALCCVLLLISAFAPDLLLGEKSQFQSPTFDIPYYRIVLAVDLDQDRCTFQEVQVNGRKWESFLAFQNGKNIDLSKPVAKGRYVIEVDYAWSDNKEYRISVLSKSEEAQETQKFEIQGIAPSQGGISSEHEGFYRSYRAEELVGIERRGEICTAICTVPQKDFENQEFILMDGPTLIPYQILDVRESVPPEKSAASHPQTLTYQLAFPLDISARGKKLLLLFKGEKKADKPGFIISGDDLGKTIKNSFLELELHPQNGQVNTIQNNEHAIKLYNEAGVIHWNPGVHIPGIAWDHSFNWNPPPSFDEKAGKYLYINTRRGPLQRIKDVNLEVRYTMGTNWPYFISETMMTFKKDLGVSAVRNDEMVLYKELFDSFVYRDKEGEIIKMPLEEKRDFPDGLVHVGPDDLGWVGLVNSEKKYGFFSIRIDYVNAGLSPAGTWLNKPGTYFYAPSSGKYVYWVRPLLYTWSEFTTRNLLTFVPEGSVFYEKNAYLILPLDSEFPEKLDMLLKKLKNPVRVY